MILTDEDARQFIEAVARLDAQMTDLSSIRAPSIAAGNATIKINAGGIGIWLCTVFTAICAVTTIEQAFNVYSLRQQMFSIQSDSKVTLEGLRNSLETTQAYADRAQRTADEAKQFAEKK